MVIIACFDSYNTLEICTYGKEKRMERMSATKSRAIYMLKALVISYVITLFLLLIVSFLMHQTGMGGTAVSIAVIVITVISVFIGSFYLGKHVEQKRFIWGLIAAMVYFIVYILISLLVKGDTPVDFLEYGKKLLMIAASGMLGGMLS